MPNDNEYLEIARCISSYPDFYADLAGEAIKALVKENEELREQLEWVSMNAAGEDA